MSTQATKEISDWLEKLGMSEYAQRFAENDIDACVLPHLTIRTSKNFGLWVCGRLATPTPRSPTPSARLKKLARSSKQLL